ncbi:MAG: PH domain-containing protein [bacterium]|nr:PH domain-containing protein [bacterium]
MAEHLKTTEKVIYEGHTSWAKYWYLIGMGGLFIASGIQLVNSPGTNGAGYLFGLPGPLLIGIAYLGVRATSYTVTSERVIRKKGLFSPKTSEVAASDIEHVLVKQGSTERLLGIGNVVITTTDPSQPEIIFAGVQSPRKVAGMIPGRRPTVSRRRLGE